MMNQNNRLRLYTFASSAKIQEGKYYTKKYLHFDNIVSFQNIKDKVTNPCWVSRHGFYPFIHFQMKFSKYNKKENKKKSKEREIYYASHVDSYIYKYYGDILNYKYNDVVDKLGFSEVSIAYRNNFPGKSNIHFAKEVISFLTSQNEAFIYVADFTKFFDKIDHKYLKEKIKSVLGVKTLPDDFYTVFKNITKFSWIEKKDIDEYLKEKYGVNKPNLTRYFSEKEFRNFKKGNTYKNTKDFGIPQGAGISSVFSNIYLLEFDRLLNAYAKKNNGLYRRYCDDLIIVIPIKNSHPFNREEHENIIEKARKQIPNLELQKEKTEKYFYKNNEITNMENQTTKLNYLGFNFDGVNVKIREKSLFKYFNRAYKKVRICNRLTQKTNQKSQRRKLYKTYTHLGKKSRGYGNFLTYASRAQKEFDKNSTTNNLMEHQVKNHWKRINARLKK